MAECGLGRTLSPRHDRESRSGVVCLRHNLHLDRPLQYFLPYTSPHSTAALPTFTAPLPHHRPTTIHHLTILISQLPNIQNSAQFHRVYIQLRYIFKSTPTSLKRENTEVSLEQLTTARSDGQNIKIYLISHKPVAGYEFQNMNRESVIQVASLVQISASPLCMDHSNVTWYGENVYTIVKSSRNSKLIGKLLPFSFSLSPHVYYTGLTGDSLQSNAAKHNKRICITEAARVASLLGQQQLTRACPAHISKHARRGAALHTAHGHCTVQYGELRAEVGTLVRRAHFHRTAVVEWGLHSRTRTRTRTTLPYVTVQYTHSISSGASLILCCRRKSPEVAWSPCPAAQCRFHSPDTLPSRTGANAKVMETLPRLASPRYNCGVIVQTK
ncbi:hypothetical protein J6590_067178 [Homalodisca vitripennis]|nr:hypothetical protein J6590_067178 [Homalodisca vitripennis]